MRIEIDVTAANDPEAHQWLDRILHRVKDGWHVWDLTSFPNVDGLRSTPWIRDPGRSGGLARTLLVASTQRRGWTLAPHGRRVRVTVQPTAAHELVPEAAFRLADEPLVILVENRQSDGAFVERVVKELDRSIRGLWSRRGEPIRFDSVGGRGQMSQEVEKRAGSAPYRPRLVAVIDSDRNGPKDPESDAALALRAACERHGLPCWVLAKREAENYLPRVLLRARPNAGDKHERLVDAWDALNDDQKDHFDMKRGLSHAPPTIEQELFDELPDAQRRILAEGFGPNVHECWTQWQVRDAKEELRMRGRGDLERGIGLIRKEL